MDVGAALRAQFIAPAWGAVVSPQGTIHLALHAAPTLYPFSLIEMYWPSWSPSSAYLTRTSFYHFIGGQRKLLEVFLKARRQVPRLQIIRFFIFPRVARDE